MTANECVFDTDAIRQGGMSRTLLYTSALESVSLQNWYAKRTVFLTLSGPSLATFDLAQLNQRGIVTFGVNNSWSVHRPTLWTCVDPPGRFLDIGWKDPGIIKLVPLYHRNRRLRVKEPDGRFRQSQFFVRDMPAVFFYARSTRFDPDTFFSEPEINWGNPPDQADSLGIKGGRSVMLAALRLIHYLGFRVVFLLGADFKMNTDAAQNYAFAQGRTKHAVDHNNRLYESLDRRFSELRKRFNDFWVFNCTPDSGLRAFPYYPFDKAVAYARAECGKTIDTVGWYDTPAKPKPRPKSLDEQREHERQKYVKLAHEKPHYGATNHGRDAIELVARLNPGYVVDLGCGRNLFVKMLRERLPGVRADGVDFVFDEADIKAPMHKLPLADDCADVVTAFDSLEHLLPDEVDAVLAEIARILKPGGTFIASICYQPSRTKVDGEGLHPTVKPEAWWTAKLARVGDLRPEGKYLCARPNYGHSADVSTFLRCGRSSDARTAAV